MFFRLSQIKFTLIISMMTYSSLVHPENESKVLFPPWIEIFPGGETKCARDGEFSFFYAPGSLDKVVIDFMGGGACWNSETCDESGTFTDSVDYFRERYQQGLEGVYNRSDERNPLKDWHHIVIPYCTGDIHWGSNQVHYERADNTTFRIKHYGAINAKGVLDWVDEHIKTVKTSKVLVTGCSAGAYGSIYWTPYIQNIFQNSKVIQLGDAGAGIITSEFFQNSFPLWHPIHYAPTWIPSLSKDNNNWTNLTLSKFYQVIGDYYPQIKFAQFNNEFDRVQMFFYEIMGGDPRKWNQLMQESLLTIHSNLPNNFSSFIEEGSQHCIIPYNRFYDHKNKDKKPFIEWFSQYVTQN